MKRLHLAISTDDIAASVEDFSLQFECEPCVIVAGEYALWRTDNLNVSLPQDRRVVPGQLRHLGWEDDSAEAFSVQTDRNGIVWERFTAQQQADEINDTWPEAMYQPKDLDRESMQTLHGENDE